MKILISNDDGHGSSGVVALKESLKQQHFCWYALPDRDRSGASHSLTLHRPIKIRRKDFGIVVEGTPADCVKLSLSGLCDFQPDIVISGINAGANLGTDVIYSGTVAAAMEGACAGLPAIAVSLVGTKYFSTAACWLNTIVEALDLSVFPAGTLLNINIPDLPASKIKGCKLSRLGQRDFSRNLQKIANPRSKELYWIGLPGAPVLTQENTDFNAIAKGYISITPLAIGKGIESDAMPFANLETIKDI